MFLIQWIVFTIAVLIATYVIPGVHATLVGAIVLAVVLGIINLFFKPIIKILTLPINIITLGLFSFVVNALLVMLADIIVKDFTVDGFWYALLFSLAVSIVNAFFLVIIRKA